MRIRQHVNPLRADYLGIAPAALALPPGRPVEVELGCAEAWFLLDRARAEPDGHYIGVELRRELVRAANRAAAAAGLANVECVFANLNVDLPRLFPPGSVRRFWLYFPDPWWKARQRKRRVMSPVLAAELSRLCAPGGEVHVATDIFELALDAMAALEGQDGLANLAGAWSFTAASPVAARSRRERECEDKGARIWRLAYRRG